MFTTSSGRPDKSMIMIDAREAREDEGEVGSRDDVLLAGGHP